MTYTVVTPAASEPVTTQEVEDYCRMDGNEADGIINGLISAARSLVEVQTHRVLMPTTLRLALDSFPGNSLTNTAIMLAQEGRYGDGMGYTDWRRLQPNRHRAIYVPLPPLTSVSSITYVDTNGATQTLGAGNYLVDTDSEPGRITPAYNVDWPVTRCQANAVLVNFIAGYATAALVPAQLKQAILMLVAYWFDNPNAAAAPLSEQPLAVRALVGSTAVPQVR